MGAHLSVASSDDYISKVQGQGVMLSKYVRFYWVWYQSRLEAILLQALATTLATITAIDASYKPDQTRPGQNQNQKQTPFAIHCSREIYLSYKTMIVAQ